MHPLDHDLHVIGVAETFAVIQVGRDGNEPVVGELSSLFHGVLHHAEGFVDEDDPG